MGDRRRHLSALGIDAWVERTAAAPAIPSAETNRPTAENEAAPVIGSMGWDELEACLKTRCRGEASRAVFGVGARDAELMVIGEAPGLEEDRVGEPFVGPAGQLLDAMLAAIGRDRRQNVYIANICKFRPPDNRDPLAGEVKEDMPFLLRQIELVNPVLILALGRVAAQNLLQLDLPLGRMRGTVHQLPGSERPVLATYHPAYLLRAPQEKAMAWTDLKAVRSLLQAR